MLYKILLIYLCAINLVAFLAYGLDKLKAKKDKWRIPEKVLILLAVLGIVIFTVMFPYIFVFGFFYYGGLFVVLCEAVLKSIFKNHTKQATVAAYFLGAVLAIAFILLLLWRAFLEE